MSVCLDGYIQGPGHDISWHRVEDEVLALKAQPGGDRSEAAAA